MERIEKIFVDKKVYSDLLDRYNEANADYQREKFEQMGFGNTDYLCREANDMYYRLALETFDGFTGEPGTYELEEGLYELFCFFMKNRNWNFEFLGFTEDRKSVLIEIEE